MRTEYKKHRNQTLQFNWLLLVLIFSLANAACSGSSGDDDNEVPAASSVACADESLNSGACLAAANRYVSSFLGSHVTGSAGSLSSVIPAGYYSGAQMCTMSDAQLTAANIKNGVAIFGITGTYEGESRPSNALRSKGTSPISFQAETTTYAGTDLPAGFREVPRISIDNDGSSNSTVTYVSRTGWGDTECGTTQASIALRVADCAANATIGPEATWDGSIKGNAGQGIWKLVTRKNYAAGINKEVWQDQRTGLIWSDMMDLNMDDTPDSLSWCQASGSNNSSTVTDTAVKEDDPHNLCDNSSYQITNGPPTSACFEHPEFSTTHVDNPGKAGLKKTSTPAIRWRLPTKYDYQEADNNGLRFVVPSYVTSSSWTATLQGTGFNAFYFLNGDGTNADGFRMSNGNARCVGR